MRLRGKARHLLCIAKAEVGWMGEKRRNACLNLTEAAPGPNLRRVSKA